MSDDAAGSTATTAFDLVGGEPAVREAVQRRRLLLEAFPGTAAARAIGAVAQKIGT